MENTVTFFPFWIKLFTVITSAILIIFPLEPPPHDKTNKMVKWVVHPANTQISLFDQSLLSAWRNFGSLATHWAHSEDADRSDWADAQADLSLRWAHSHIVGFVMRWLIYLPFWCFSFQAKAKYDISIRRPCDEKTCLCHMRTCASVQSDQRLYFLLSR